MGERAVLNRVKKYKELEEQKKVLEEQMEALKNEIKADMESKGVEETYAGNFIIRFVTVVSSRLDTKALKAENEALYKQYLRQSESKRFTIA